ncbi:MAG: hypothetical protein A3J76_01345 [Candidatus Moranbacteria bacterium RBG_13_45_13]|nr:MAG: hypothetical protein A3J76_01345 [Candidatus Moranbacteria bacterium RBG_13_45_13]
MTEKIMFPLGLREEYAHAEALRAVESVGEKECQRTYQERYDEAYLEFPIIEKFDTVASRENVPDEIIAAMYSDLITMDLEFIAPQVLAIIAARRPELGRKIAQAIAEA